MNFKGQGSVIMLLMAFVLLVTFSALSPSINLVVSDYSYYSTSDRLIVQLMPTMLALGILVSIVVYFFQGRQQTV